MVSSRSIVCSAAAPVRGASIFAPMEPSFRSFVPVGDAFAGLVIPVVESAADALILGELSRVRRCADPRCQRVFFDNTKNGRRRWCDMSTCGNRAKAARHREKLKSH
jgi:predicted RNA-binding Zn ribbon-like protein